MLRISAAIAVLTLVGTTANVSAAQPQKPPTTNACSLESCIATCKKEGIDRWVENGFVERYRLPNQLWH
jgi:hypothetical protein